MAQSTAQVIDFNTGLRYVREDYNDNKDWIVPRGFINIDNLKDFFVPPSSGQKGLRQSDLLALYLLCSTNHNERYGIIKRSYDQDELIESVGLKSCQGFYESFYTESDDQETTRRQRNFYSCFCEVLERWGKVFDLEVSHKDKKLVFIIDFSKIGNPKGNQINYDIVKNNSHDYDFCLTYIGLCLWRDQYENVRGLEDFIGKAFNAETKQAKYRKRERVRKAIEKINRFAIKGSAGIRIRNIKGKYDLFSIIEKGEGDAKMQVAPKYNDATTGEANYG